MLVYLIVSVICLIGLLRYYIIFRGVKKLVSISEEIPKGIPVSLIICAKNELQNIEKHFPYWIGQAHNDFELIIVDDESSDGSTEYLKQLAKDNERLKVVTIPVKENKHGLQGKRFALKAGIKAATHPHIILSDADCYPLSKHWLQIMSAQFSKDVQIVLGVSPYIPQRGLLFQLIAYETTLTALQFLGWALQGEPYMSLGRNVGYKKSLLSDDVFQASNKSLSGDDDLIFQQVFAQNNLGYAVNADAYAVSKPKTSWVDYFKQKVRHYGSAGHYKTSIKRKLGIYSLLNILFYLSIYGGIIFGQNFLFILLLPIKAFMFRFLCEPIPKILLTPTLKASFIIADFLYWHTHPFLYIFSIFSAKNGWKEENRR